MESSGTGLHLKYGDHDLLRFCRARKFKYDDVQLMFQKYIDWRAENNVETIIWDWEWAARDLVRPHYPQFYHKTDK
jgi:hypothetical protein